MTKRNFSELQNLNSFEDRYNYLKLSGKVGIDVFGEERYINQQFYRSQEWRSVRRKVIVRDGGLDLGCEGYLIAARPMIHHMNPISMEDIIDFNPEILDPEFLITVSVSTHLAIHYGDKNLLPRLSNERHQGDTRLW